MKHDEYIEMCSKKLENDGFTVYRDFAVLQSALQTTRVEDSNAFAKVMASIPKLDNANLFTFIHKGHPLDYIASFMKFFEVSPN